MGTKVLMVPPTGIGVGTHDGHVTIAFRGLSEQLGLADDLDVLLALTASESRQLAQRILSKADELDSEEEPSRH